MTSTSKPAYTHTVEVGKADYSITPDVVRAEVGDFIRYQFYPRNHSIVRAEYGYPCIPYELVNTRPGFYSGFRPVDSILNNAPSFTVRVNDTDPIFVYCSGPWACVNHGMVAVVNPNANTSLERHRQLALESSFVLQPGDDWPSEADTKPKSYTTASTTQLRPQTVTLNPTTSSSSTPVSTSVPVSTASSTSIASVAQSNNNLTGGAIAGIAIGAAAVLVLATIAIWICGRRSSGSHSSDENWTWSRHGKKDLFKGTFSSDKATPATMPPAYNHHGVPIVTQNKAYANGVIPTSLTEQYITGTRSPPPPISPHYAQQNFSAHMTDAAPFQHSMVNAPQIVHGQAYAAPMVPQQYAMANERGLQQQRSEIYSGTPAPQQGLSVVYGVSRSGEPSAAPLLNRNSLSLSANSRGGSPDHTAEMNAARSQAGTLNQAGGGMLQQPMPLRPNDSMFSETKNQGFQHLRGVRHDERRELGE